MRTASAVIVLASSTLTAGIAVADIVNVGGSAVIAEPPADISNGVWTSNTQIRSWFEREQTLFAGLTLDHVNTGLVDLPEDLTPGLLPAGMNVWSYMVRFDPATSGTHTLSGFVVFDTPILGVLQDRPTLIDSDTLLGRPGVIYNTNNNRGMEPGDPAGEWFSISADRLRLDFEMTVTNAPTDDIRIVTAIPAPASAIILAAGSVALIGRRRRSS